MVLLAGVITLLLAYLAGSIPFGVLFVRIISGKDIRTVESGRTGGTNAFRAAGVWAGIFTAIMDTAKGFATVYLARFIVPGNLWIEILAPLAAIIGHNYSIFLMERTEKGYRLRGGAGGAPCVGGSIGFWPPSLLIILPIAILIIYFVGYASLVTMSMGLITMIIFAVRAYLGLSPWQYALYGLLAEVILLWSLRPNIKRLLTGNERVVGYRARHHKNKTAQSRSVSSSSTSSS